MLTPVQSFSPVHFEGRKYPGLTRFKAWLFENLDREMAKEQKPFPTKTTEKTMRERYGIVSFGSSPEVIEVILDRKADEAVKDRVRNMMSVKFKNRYYDKRLHFMDFPTGDY